MTLTVFILRVEWQTDKSKRVYVKKSKRGKFACASVSNDTDLSFRIFAFVGYVSRWGLMALNMHFQLEYFFLCFLSPK